MALRTKIAVFIALLVGAMALGACNTVAGVGEDISDAGEGLSDIARDIGDG